MKYLIIPFVLISNFIFAQNYYSDAYIILKDQTDTIKGQIIDKNWNVNPTEIEFKSNITVEKKYQISELKAFGVSEKDHYVVKTVDLDVSPFELKNLLTSPKIITVKDTTLALRVFLKADMNLLFLKEKNLKEHFYYSNNKETKELILHKYLKVKPDKSFEVSNKMYQKQMGVLFSDCKDKIATDDINLNQIEMVNAFIKYNDCKGCTSTCYIKSKAEKNKITINLILGNSQFLQGEYFRDYFNDINIYKENLKFPFTFGIGTNIYSKRNNGNTIITAELWYQNQKINNSESETTTQFNNINFSFLYKKRFIKASNVNPYFGGGINFKYNLKPDLNNIQKITFMDFSKFQQSILFDSGLEIKRLTLSARINLNVLSSDLLKIDYLKVAEAFLVNTNSRIGTQFILSYRIL